MRRLRRHQETTMPHYVMTYRGPKGYLPTPESTPLWRAWFDTMGERLVDLGKPVRDAATVGNCASDTTELDGYSIIEAENIDAAIEVAKGCPHLRWDGGVELGLLTEVPPVQ
jgi:hypothetical protein